MKKSEIVIIVIVGALLCVISGGGLYVRHLQTELHQKTQASSQRGPAITTPLGETSQQALDNCLNNVNEWLQSNSGVTGAYNQELLIQEQQAKINTCKAEYSNNQ